MNIEELSKSQLILLTILVNFVTSVATGILTVSLLDHAPAFVTQTVNRVVERTIETVAAAAPAAIIQAPAPSNQDLVTAAIGADAARAVAIYAADTGTSTPAIAIGTYLPKSRAIATAAQDALPKEVLVGFTDGSYSAASLAHEGSGIAIYGFADKTVLPKASSPILIASNELRLGETALALSADGAAATGIVARVSEKGIHTTLPDIGAGSAVVDLSGNLIGIGAGVTPGLLISADKVTSLLTATSTTATSTAAAK
ncbi:MAG: hypothetical protein PHV99_00235 [Candidatus Pacebacteria bacterium]|nr:hypothetical protein [Candidatus Paceibacterota bacterium]